MIRLIFVVILIVSCRTHQPQQIRYYWERPSKDITVKSLGRYHTLKSPHYIPIRGDSRSNDLVNKYNLLYNMKRYGLERKTKR